MNLSFFEWRIFHQPNWDSQTTLDIKWDIWHTIWQMWVSENASIAASIPARRQLMGNMINRILGFHCSLSSANPFFSPQTMTGWWFQTWMDYFPYMGCHPKPIDELHHFPEGWWLPPTNQLCFNHPIYKPWIPMVNKQIAIFPDGHIAPPDEGCSSKPCLEGRWFTAFSKPGLDKSTKWL